MRKRIQSSLIIATAAVGFSLISVRPALAKPIIVSAPNSTRAIAIEAVDFTQEPFATGSASFLYAPDRRTRIMIFVLNLSLQPNENASAVTSDAEDAGHQHYNLAVEFVGKISGQEWLTATVLRLDPAIGDAGDVLISLTYQGVASNRVRVGIGHIGGGPPDDAGAGPTPAPPYTLNGQITLGGAGLSGVAINLRGTSSADTVTDNNGTFQFTLTSAGDYSVAAARQFFTLTPATILLPNFANSQTINFVAVRNTFLISGVVKDNQGNAVSGVLVKLESGAGGPPARTITTGNDGSFAFPDVPAGFDYTITPQNTSLFAFTSQSVAQFNGNLALTFSGTLRTYTISGFIADKYQAGVSAVSVTLSGAANASTTTDANGNYSFNDLFAGRDYSVTASKPDHFVTPAARNVTLLQNERMDFSAVRYYIIKGKVADQNGKGLMGIQISLTGPETATMRTPQDGSYSFTVTTAGDYTLTPTRLQNFYQFSPAVQSINNLSDHQTINFTGAIVINSPVSVLEFDGTPMTVDHGVFWPSDTIVGQFFWEVWAMPSTDNFARYMISDGYGGAHVILFGFTEGYPGRYALTGNVWNGTTTFSFRSDEGPSPGEWAHFAVGWDGNSIITYYDGVPVGKQLFSGPRVSTGSYNGATLLFIGGSSHQNFNGRLAQVRGYEENNPRASAPESSFTPQTVFSVDGQFLEYFFRTSQAVADLSYGYRGNQHDGSLRSMLNYFGDCNGCPIPQYVFDPTAPDFSNANNPGQANTLVGQPAAPPSGARVFDSFSRNNSTYVLNGKGGLGTSETGNSTWQTNVDSPLAQPFGILAGRAVVLADTAAVAWVPVTTETGNLDVRVDRNPGTFGTGANTGLCFRVVDKNNFFFAYSSNDAANPSGPKVLTLGYYQAGVKTTLADNVVMPANWITFRVLTKGTGDINVYADSTLVYSTSNVLNASAGGAGLFNQGAGMGLQNRWDNFTVLDAQPSP